MARGWVVAALLLTAAAGGARAACPDRAVWPTAAFPDRTAEVGLTRKEAIRALEAYAFSLTGADADRIGVRTDGVLIVQAGQIVYERYARGYGADLPHYGWSVTKSVINALTGIAVAEGLLSIEDSVCRFVTLPRADHCDIKVRDLLEFASGLAWTESYEGQSNQVSSVLAMLYGEGRHDMLRFVAGHDSRDPPGATYMYSSGDSTFLAGVVARALRARGPDFAWDLLFTPIGMRSAVLEEDEAGTPVGGSYLYATLRDYARFGYLFLADGCWEGRRLLPEGWVSDSTAVSAPFRRRTIGRDPGDVQGRQWWLNLPVPEAGQATPWPHAPADAYAARGHWGQSITVVPSADAVIVRTADDRDGTFDVDRFLGLALAVLP
jgi:CubicO group peptidase (beta-lactamase class C family)